MAKIIQFLYCKIGLLGNIYIEFIIYYQKPVLFISHRTANGFYPHDMVMHYT